MTSIHTYPVADWTALLLASKPRILAQVCKMLGVVKQQAELERRQREELRMIERLKKRGESGRKERKILASHRLTGLPKQIQLGQNS